MKIKRLRFSIQIKSGLIAATCFCNVQFYLLFWHGVCEASAQTISTIAGTGTAGFSADGIIATSAKLNYPSGVAVDVSGNVYIADQSNHRIRKINTSGVISTFAGTGVSGFNGDGTIATNAQLFYPTGVAVDASGNVYIAEGHRIRKVNTVGIISSIAGTGVGGFNGDGVPALTAQLYDPRGVAVDVSGNVYIADLGNHRTRKVNTSGVISTIAGTGAMGFSGDGGSAINAKLNFPRGVAVDVSGNVYIADQDNHRLRKVNTSGVISTFAGTGVAGFGGDGGSAINAHLKNPSGVIVDASGSVYVADYSNNRIRKIDTSGIISTFAGNGVHGFSGDGGVAINAQLKYPFGVALGASYLYVADANNHRVRKVDGIASAIDPVYADEAQLFSIYPNPSNGKMQIISNHLSVISIEIYNVFGEKIASSNPFTSGRHEWALDLSSKPNGIYFVQLLSETESFTQKLILQK